MTTQAYADLYTIRAGSCISNSPYGYNRAETAQISYS